MAYVIAEPCVGCKDRSCVPVCPCDCIQEGKDQFFINPDECIDCGLCEPECPVDTIFLNDEVPQHWQHSVALNAVFFQKK